MNTETMVAGFSATVAFGAAAMAALTARGASVRDSFVLARTLYGELTSTNALASRSALEFYRRSNRRSDQETKTVLDHYFALLWAFERVLAGRQSLSGQLRLNRNATSSRLPRSHDRLAHRRVG